MASDSRESSGSDSGSEESEDERELLPVADISIEEEALQLLEWHRVCQQVARFADTTMGLEAAASGQMQVGSSLEESVLLLDQTQAAICLPRRLSFEGAVDVRGIVGRASRGLALSGADICLVGQFLKAAGEICGELGLVEDEEGVVVQGTPGSGLRVGPAVEGSSRDGTRSNLGPLQQILVKASLSSGLSNEIDRCLNPMLRSVKDDASPYLAEVRSARRENIRELEAKLKSMARDVFAAGGSDFASVTQRRGRSCISIRANAKGMMPGSLTLDTSSSGATLYVEPAEAIEGNNMEAELANEESAEEARILSELSAAIAAARGKLENLTTRMVELDLACARGRHALWLEGKRPEFFRAEQEKGVAGSCGFQVKIQGVRHPLLLAMALDAQSKSEGSADQGSVAEGRSRLPVAIDIEINQGVKVVAITGPNAGGKTATLKTIGVSMLMAKAGLFLAAHGQPVIPWFSKVLVDIGDEQSLEQSLSTFSGHIRRIARILASVAADPDPCLVLLDEVGSGTDPSEGASLAVSILRHLADSARLTVATTHYAELKNVEDDRFENASVEFDPATLRPTYKVLWGCPGQSNALAIAALQGFDVKILQRARELCAVIAEGKEGQTTGNGFQMRGAGVSGDDVDIVEELEMQMKAQLLRAEAAGEALQDAQRLHSEIAVQHKNLVQRELAQRKADEALVREALAEAKAKFGAEVAAFQEAVAAGPIKQDLEAQVRSTISKAAHEVLQSETFKVEAAEDDRKLLGQEVVSFTGRLKVGDLVLVKKLGGAKASVTIVDGNEVTVKLGNMTSRVKIDDVVRVKGVRNEEIEYGVEDTWF